MSAPQTVELGSTRVGGHELDLYQSSLPVRLIATPRGDFVTCKEHETLRDIRDRNARDAFDYLPVVDHGDVVIGVLDTDSTKALPDETHVERAYEPLGERFLVGSDASIFDFLQQADERPFRFLVTSDGISGLVSLSDVQRLPVRAALFAMVTQLEMAMAGLIDAVYKQDKWIDLLTDGRRQKLKGQMELARGDNNLVTPLLYTQFADKVKITREIWGHHAGASDIKMASAELSGFEKLRNQVAHANEFGVTRASAVAIACKARSMRLWVDRIERLKVNVEEGQQ